MRHRLRSSFCAGVVAAMFFGVVGLHCAGAALGRASRLNESKLDMLLKRFDKEFVTFTPGTGKYPPSFQMGSDSGSTVNEQPAHRITFRGPFAIAKYEVTQELYQEIMGRNPSRWKGPRNAVEMVSWDEANAFCRKVSEALRQRNLLGSAAPVRLPSEAEWEYACRAGTKTRYSFGDKADDLTLYGWFAGNAKGNDPPVGAKRPNGWGLYDMHGYVWEWCADAWHPDYREAPTDEKPRQGSDKAERVIRGGAWTEPAECCTSAHRQGRAPATRSDAIGFRCVRAGIRDGGEEGQANDKQ
jgi:formylglycine-generating enzyme required for sulfatase activity